MPFAVNKCVREIQQGRGMRHGNAWRGDLVVAKFSDQLSFLMHVFQSAGADHANFSTYMNLVDAKMSDFPIVKNYFLTNMSPLKVRSGYVGL